PLPCKGEWCGTHAADSRPVGRALESNRKPVLVRRTGGHRGAGLLVRSRDRALADWNTRRATTGGAVPMDLLPAIRHVPGADVLRAAASALADRRRPPAVFPGLCDLRGSSTSAAFRSSLCRPDSSRAWRWRSRLAR